MYILQPKSEKVKGDLFGEQEIVWREEAGFEGTTIQEKPGKRASDQCWMDLNSTVHLDSLSPSVKTYWMKPYEDYNTIGIVSFWLWAGRVD